VIGNSQVVISTSQVVIGTSRIGMVLSGGSIRQVVISTSQVVIGTSRIGVLLPSGSIRLCRTSNLLATLGKQAKKGNILQLLIIILSEAMRKYNPSLEAWKFS
jgi:hypothetical protein